MARRPGEETLFVSQSGSHKTFLQALQAVYNDWSIFSQAKPSSNDWTNFQIKVWLAYCSHKQLTCNISVLEVRSSRRVGDYK